VGAEKGASRGLRVGGSVRQAKRRSSGDVPEMNNRGQRGEKRKRDGEEQAPFVEKFKKTENVPAQMRRTAAGRSNQPYGAGLGGGEGKSGGWCALNGRKYLKSSPETPARK